MALLRNFYWAWMAQSKITLDQAGDQLSSLIGLNQNLNCRGTNFDPLPSRLIIVYKNFGDTVSKFGLLETMLELSQFQIKRLLSSWSNRIVLINVLIIYWKGIV